MKEQCPVMTHSGFVLFHFVRYARKVLSLHPV